MSETITNLMTCPRCRETSRPCACQRNLCRDCSQSVGNVLFTRCDGCQRAFLDKDTKRKQRPFRESGKKYQEFVRGKRIYGR